MDEKEKGNRKVIIAEKEKVRQRREGNRDKKLDEKEEGKKSKIYKEQLSINPTGRAGVIVIRQTVARVRSVRPCGPKA